MGRPGSGQGVNGDRAAFTDFENYAAAKEEFHAEQGFAVGLDHLNNTWLALPEDCRCVASKYGYPASDSFSITGDTPRQVKCPDDPWRQGQLSIESRIYDKFIRKDLPAAVKNANGYSCL